MSVFPHFRRSLALKLTLAFLFVSLTGIALVSFLASRITAVEFGNYITEQNQTLLAEQLADYYTANGGWTGVHQLMPRILGRHMMGMGGAVAERNPFAITDAQGVVVLPGGGLRVGERIALTLARTGAPIVVNGEVVGYVVEPGEAEQRQMQAFFARRVNLAILLAAVGAVGVSLLLAGVLSRNLTRPLQELTHATHQMTQGYLAQQVPVRSEDELGQLAASFNQMSAQVAQSQALRRQMTADIAHDLRTPLSIILGHAEALRDGVLPANQATLDIVYDEARRLNRLIEDLRILSLAEAGELPLALRPVSPQSLLERVYTAHLPQAADKQIALGLDVSAQLPLVQVDPDRMAQVLDNLVGNALRFTPADGRVTLSSRRQDHAVLLSVQDSGPGLSPDALAHAFDRFYRGDAARQRYPDGGSGLGLAIVKSLVEAQHGRVWAESQPGQGAAFCILLPTYQTTSP
ncbi:MAG TPA: ATP-binding protein [Chloroflexota bacterium]|nr:ATP-binding protein [Chloroflexota bacterium]